MVGTGVWGCINFGMLGILSELCKTPKNISLYLAYGELFWVACMLVWVALMLVPSLLLRQSSPSRSLYRCLSFQWMSQSGCNSGVKNSLSSLSSRAISSSAAGWGSVRFRLHVVAENIIRILAAILSQSSLFTIGSSMHNNSKLSTFRCHEGLIEVDNA